MKFSENWLRQHVKTGATREELAATLTAIGLEVEEMTVLGTALALLSNGQGRRLIVSRDGLIALLVALAVFAPNIVWNFTHHFETVGHTAANANIGGHFQVSKLFEFLGAQIGIFGPIAAAFLIWGLFRGWRGPRDRP